MNQMVCRCWALQYLNISKWRPQRIQTMKEMFSGCKSLVRLNHNYAHEYNHAILVYFVVEHIQSYESFGI